MTDTNREYIWIIAGGILQVPLIKKAKEMGYGVIVSDQNPKSPGGLLADQFIELDTYDVNGHIQIANGMKVKPKAVLTAGADVGPTVSAVAEQLGLPAERFDVAVACRNKLEVRRIQRKMGILRPVFLAIEWDDYSPHGLWKAHCRIAGVDPYPCVVKPLASSGSKGISLVKNPFEFTRAVKLAQSYGTRRANILVEEYLDREMEVALDFFVEKGEFILANASRRIFYSKFGIEAGHINPWNPPDEALELCWSIGNALGVKFGPFKVDLFKDKRYGWLVLETATRLSGGFDHMTTGEVIGKNVTQVMIDVALGQKVKRRQLKPNNGIYSCAFAPMYRPGRITGWKYPNEAKGLVDIIPLSRDQIKPIENCASRPIFVISTGQSSFDALKNAIRISRKVEPIYVT